MPRFFFHILGGEEASYDYVGLELSDRETAVALAAEIAMLLIADSVADGKIVDMASFVEVCNPEGEMVDVVPFKPLAIQAIKHL